MYWIEICDNDSDQSRLCIHFGSGVVGKAIVTQLLKKGRLISHHHVDWSNIEPTLQWIAVFAQKQQHYDFIDIVWAAGKAKFSDCKSVTQKEEQDFESLLKCMDKSFSSAKAQIRFWLMSSAGGLFEGQTNIDQNSKINCLRPYADLKLSQESCASRLFPSIICRISSVYSLQNLRGRMGLITTLVSNSFYNRVCTISGDPSTLRDFVLDDDVGTFVSNGIVFGTDREELQYLINGRSLSIQNIISMIEDLTFRKLFIRYSSSNRNAANMSFSPKLRANAFYNSSLNSNLRILWNNILSNQISV